MEKSYSDSYKAAGVDVTAGYRSVELIKSHVARTTTPQVLDSIGGFGGMYAPDMKGMERPVFVSGTDGVGTKVKLAFMLDKHDTVGIDCVAMCVNDIICTGAKPMFFLDYIACGKNIPEKIEQIVKGVAEGCVQSGAALIGGETAEHPGLMAEDEYDLAGFSVGIIDEKKILDKANVKAGNAIIALPSSGVHSNGFSLVRKVFDIENTDSLYRYEERLGKPLGEVLLTPTKIYVKPVLALLEKVQVNAIAHITGGGFYENMPRAFEENLSARVHKGTWNIPEVFKLIEEVGNIPEHDMYNTFNMGVGMIAIVEQKDAETAVNLLRENGIEASVIGEMIEGDHSVIIEEN
ncbi:MAG: phosphoribosylformylglycinamidine cyclo-ligase [Erysipelotrichaceae bacterium]|jgi:phosphoribosylformylglycinamidine cyclo-ligase|nr:phosphoribosylformylglycinamidine cyclo-ligase [Erysipelotrichaceae bacterium]